MGDGAGFTEQTTLHQTSTTGILAALLSIFYAFDGWHTAAYFTEENVDPVKSMPKSMYIGVILVASIS